MGLYIHNLSRLPVGLESDYYIYLLDYGWHEPLAEALHKNFRMMADLAAKNKAVVLAGTNSRQFADEILAVHFDDSQFSWRSINGEDGSEILPALMISTLHPNRFRVENPKYRPFITSKGAADDKLIIIPLRYFCKDTTEIVSLIERVFQDISLKASLEKFSIAKTIQAKEGSSLSDALILKPALYGVGIDLKEIFKFLLKKKSAI